MKNNEWKQIIATETISWIHKQLWNFCGLLITIVCNMASGGPETNQLTKQPTKQQQKITEQTL
jgi:hypothetical protein